MERMEMSALVDRTPVERRMGRGGEAQHLSRVAPNNVPLFLQPGTCCQKQGGRWESVGEGALTLPGLAEPWSIEGLRTPSGSSLLTGEPAGSWGRGMQEEGHQSTGRVHGRGQP